MKILLIHSITHNGSEYLPGLHDIDDALASQWMRDAPHAVSSIPVSKPGQVLPAPDSKANEPVMVPVEAPAGTSSRRKRK